VRFRAICWGRTDCRVSPDLVSTVTDDVLADVEQWQQRPLEAMYPIVYFDALRLKIRDEGTVKNKPVYLALGVRPRRWSQGSAGLVNRANRGRQVLAEGLQRPEKARLARHPYCGGRRLARLPEAIETVYPAAQIQTCIVHLIRNSLTLASWKDRKPLAAAIKPIYQAVTAEAAAAALDAFAGSEWGRRFPTIAAMWQRQWEQVIPFFAYPPEVRRIVYTTNSIESMYMQLRKIAKNRGHFRSDEAASKLLYLALRNIEKDWKRPPVTWRQAVNQFAMLFGERFTNAES